MKRPFGRGPTTLLRRLKGTYYPSLLTTYPIPGMILQVVRTRATDGRVSSCPRLVPTQKKDVTIFLLPPRNRAQFYLAQVETCYQARRVDVIYLERICKRPTKTTSGFHSPILGRPGPHPIWTIRIPKDIGIVWVPLTIKAGPFFWGGRFWNHPWFMAEKFQKGQTGEVTPNRWEDV